MLAAVVLIAKLVSGISLVKIYLSLGKEVDIPGMSIWRPIDHFGWIA